MKKDLKVFVSMPMRGMKESEIMEAMKETFDDFVDFIKRTDPAFEDCNFSLVDHQVNITTPSQVFDDPTSMRIWYLGDSIQRLGSADIVIFAEGYIKDADCHVEHAVVKEFNITTYYETYGEYKQLSGVAFKGPFIRDPYRIWSSINVTLSDALKRKGE